MRKIEANPNLFQVAPPDKRGGGDGIRNYPPRPQELPVSPEFVRLDGLAKTLFERKGTVVLCALVGVVIGFIAALLQQPVYQAKVSLEIQGFNENFLNRRDVDPTADANNYAMEPYLQTQIKLLQTDALIGRVADRLHLDQSPNPSARREQLIRNLANNLKVRLSGQTRIVEVLFEDANPALTAAFANTLADEFISQTLDRRVSATHHTGEWLAQQLKELKTTLEDSEQKLHNYVAANGLLFTSEKDSVAEASLRQLQGALLSAHEARVAEQSKYDLATDSPPAPMTDDLDSDTLRAYHIKLTDLRRELAESRAVLTPAHYKVKQIQAQINELQSAVDREQRSILERLRKSYESTKWREQMLHDDYGRQMEVVTRQSGKEVAYNTLKREVDGNRLLYEGTLQKVKEADVASAIRANNIQVVDPAKAPDKPLKPSRSMYCALGLLSGSFFGAGLVFFLERTDRRMRTPAEVRRCLDVPQLGAIPAASIDLPHSTQSLSWPVFRRGETYGGGAPAENDSVLRNWLELVTWRQRESALAESFRAVLASLLFSGGAERESRVIVITSACASEGKTTVACNL
ncbi:MAG: exopolysaccharide transport family protein, partial [Acidobacteriota bacterium]|nr:exopolysaccharide transport family protein [Acidobacteriota bacterium]